MLSLALLGIVAFAPQDAADAAPERIEQFVGTYCARCHGERRPKGDVRLKDIAFDLSSPESADLWARVLQQLQADLMPPREKRQPSRDERVAVMRELEAAVLASPVGVAYRAKMELPQYGNYVDHESLFDGSVDVAPFTPARIWRDSPYVFAKVRRVNKKVKGVQSPFTFTTPKDGIRDYAAAGTVDTSVIETATLNARAELEWMLNEARSKVGKPTKGRQRPNPLTPFVTEGTEITEAAMHAAIQATFSRVVSRPATEAELAKYAAFLAENLRISNDPEGSVRATLTAIYLSPEALYRMEWGLGAEDDHGRRHLSPEEIASSLAHTLFDGTPHNLPREGQPIRQALEKEQLCDASDVQRVVRSILDADAYRSGRGSTQPRLMRFFHEFFGHHRAPEVFKDDARVKANQLHHDPRRLVGDADNLIKVILREDQDVIEQLLSTNRALVFHDGDNEAVVRQHEQRLADLAGYDEARVRSETEKRKKGVYKKPRYKNDPEAAKRKIASIERESKKVLQQKLAEYERLKKAGISMRPVKGNQLGYTKAYNIVFRHWEWPAEQPFELPKDQRAGLLTHPAWLVAHSLNDGNDPIHRGIWVYEKLLAGRIADVPPDVDARVPEAAHKTLRERLDVVRAKACWKCHYKINPLGEAFEVFDDFGRHRKEIHFDPDGLVAALRGKGTTSKPVNAAGTLDDLGLSGVSGEFADAVQLMHRLAKTDRVRQSFIRHLFRFLLGRNEMLSDSRTLREADRTYLESGGSFRALVTSILASDSFLYRR